MSDLNTLQNDLEKLETAIELLEDGPIDYLEEDDSEKMYELLGKMGDIIYDILNIKELARMSELNKKANKE